MYLIPNGPVMYVFFSWTAGIFSATQNLEIDQRLINLKEWCQWVIKQALVNEPRDKFSCPLSPNSYIVYFQ